MRTCPSLPEVEVVRAGLERHVSGATIALVEVLHDRPVRRHPGGASGFAAALTGRRIEGARRRGKYLWLPLDNPDVAERVSGAHGAQQARPGDASRHPAGRRRPPCPPRDERPGSSSSRSTPRPSGTCGCASA
ncbi:hypothetical protein G5V59_25405 [Nocardioides sp. W3-2-3]|uniref:DNA-formamidopyrimidine glycosylase family protein n=1 Tax=Nocardioides convexus TaxID=2712224 RepID=UPI002418861C|nr:DNA-formamidopyrimidine glycosylase family protein [Nocardioides convexus]NHA01859.1 hypothetical protein [Nocardioides convexus]